IVTHDQEEAMTVADRIGVMDRGQLVQVATPPEIYEAPNSRWVADFIGEVNVIEGRVAGAGVIVCQGGGRGRGTSAARANPRDTVWIAVRPEKLRLTRAQPAENENCVVGQVSDIAYLGDSSIYKVRLDSGLVLKASAANVVQGIEPQITWDDRVWLMF